MMHPYKMTYGSVPEGFTHPFDIPSDRPIVDAPHIPDHLRLRNRNVPISGRRHGDTSGSVVVTDETVLDALLDLYRFSTEVRTFLRTQPKLASILWEASAEIDKYFGDDTVATLCLIGEPFLPSRPKELGVFLRTSETPEEALTRLDRFNDEWWLDMPSDILLKVTFLLEFA